jgi:hypothetical protein
MQASILRKFNKLTEHARNIHKIKSHMTPVGEDNASIMSGGQGSVEGTQEHNDAVVEEVEETGPTIPENHYIIGFGPKTTEALEGAVRCSFKLFWDGSIGMYMDTSLSSKNNKDLLKVLLDVRRKTAEDREPPVTFMHGIDTESMLKQTLMILKDDEQKALEAKMRAAQEKVEEEDEEEQEEEEDMALDGDESEEKLTTY